MAIYDLSPKEVIYDNPRILVVEKVDHSFPRAYFDRAYNERRIFGGGEMLFLFENHSFKMQSGMGRGSNNYVELLSLKLILLFSFKKVVRRLHFFGDSMIAIKWFNQISRCHVQTMLSIIEEILRLKLSFDQISCMHIDREWNIVAAALSKDGIE